MPEQIRQVHRYFTVRALKTGMLHSAGRYRRPWPISSAPRRGFPAVVDPVMVATSGAVLLEPEALAAVREQLLPLAALVTPNLDEVGVLLGEKPATASRDGRGRRGSWPESYGVAFLVKGGHLPGDALTDVLALPGGGVRAYTSRAYPGR